MYTRQYYRDSNLRFKKITVEIEIDLYRKIKDIRDTVHDSRGTKEIINKALKEYLK